MPQNSPAASSKLNAAWHKAHRMPKNPTLEQRVVWHTEHLTHCACRKPTGVVLDELKKRGVAGL